MIWNRRNKSDRKRIIQQRIRYLNKIDSIGNTYDRLVYFQRHAMETMAKRLDVSLVGMICDNGSKKSKHKIKS